MSREEGKEEESQSWEEASMSVLNPDALEQPRIERVVSKSFEPTRADCSMSQSLLLFLALLSHWM